MLMSGFKWGSVCLQDPQHLHCQRREQRTAKRREDTDRQRVRQTAGRTQKQSQRATKSHEEIQTLRESQKQGDREHGREEGDTEKTQIQRQAEEETAQGDRGREQRQHGHTGSKSRFRGACGDDSSTKQGVSGRQVWGGRQLCWLLEPGERGPLGMRIRLTNLAGSQCQRVTGVKAGRWACPRAGGEGEREVGVLESWQVMEKQVWPQ